jgi:hypothetical protein
MSRSVSGILFLGRSLRVAWVPAATTPVSLVPTIALPADVVVIAITRIVRPARLGALTHRQKDCRNCNQAQEKFFHKRVILFFEAQICVCAFRTDFNSRPVTVLPWVTEESGMPGGAMDRCLAWVHDKKSWAGSHQSSLNFSNFIY